MRLRAPEGVLAVSIAAVTVEGPEADIDDPAVADELLRLGWTETKTAARKAKDIDG